MNTVPGQQNQAGRPLKRKSHAFRWAVLVGAAIGTGVGMWAPHRNSPLIIGWLPGGFQVGFIHHFK